MTRRAMTRRRFMSATTIAGGVIVSVNSARAPRTGRSQTPANAPQSPQPAVITILFSVTVKEGKANEFSEVAERLTRITRAEDEGCLAYVFLQQQDSPSEYVLYEQWRDQAALEKHLAHLQSLLGPPNPGGRLPKAFLDLCEKTRVVRYRPVG